MVHFWIKKKEKKENWRALLFFFLANTRHSVDTFFVRASYDRLSVTIIIDGNSKDTKGRSPGKGWRKKRWKKERAKETVTYGVSEWPQVKGLVQPRYIIVRELWTASWLRHWWLPSIGHDVSTFHCCNMELEVGSNLKVKVQIKR